jgi:hypothetical protein
MSRAHESRNGEADVRLRCSRAQSPPRSRGKRVKRGFLPLREFRGLASDKLDILVARPRQGHDEEPCLMDFAGESVGHQWSRLCQVGGRRLPVKSKEINLIR